MTTIVGAGTTSRLAATARLAVVCLAAVLPVSLHARRLLRPRRLRRRGVAGGEAGRLLSAVVRDLVDGRHLGLLARRDPSVPGGVLSADGARRRGVRRSCTTSSTSCCMPRTASLVMAIARWLAGLSLPRRRSRRWSSCCCRCTAESVAWITGRVDSMPALFYMPRSSRMRDGGNRGATTRGRYLGSLALFFAALFTKQNTITMVATLAGLDFVAGATDEAKRQRVDPEFALPYVPFVVMTTGYMRLRYLLFGQVAREGPLNAEGIVRFRRAPRASSGAGGDGKCRRERPGHVGPDCDHSSALRGGWSAARRAHVGVLPATFSSSVRYGGRLASCRLRLQDTVAAPRLSRARRAGQSCSGVVYDARGPRRVTAWQRGA